MNRRWLYPLIIAVNTAHAAGEIEYFGGLHNSVWEFSGSKKICELRHPVPNYGITRFTYPAGGDLEFKVESFRPPPEKGKAVMRELTPAWLHEEPDASEYSIPVTAGTQPIALGGVHSRWMLNTLARGRIGSFDYREGADDWSRIRVSVSPVNFQEPYTEFRNCTRRLQAPGPELADVQDIRFPTDVWSLNRKARARLKQVAQKVVADKDIVGVAVHGHADSRGTRRYNQGLSSRRAESVSRYLMRNGLQSKKITVQAYGETRPKQDNRSRSGRAANRRVELELIRAPEAGKTF